MFVKPNYNVSKEKGEKTGQMLELAYLMPDCWIEICFHREGPATSQLDQGFSLSSLHCPLNSNINNFALMYPSK
jgi:hypothetical protein